MSKFRGVVIAAQFGGPRTGVDNEIPLLKRVVEEHMRLARAHGIESIHMVFRVDGELASYHCKQAERLKIMSKRQEAWVDLGVPISAWQERPGMEVRLFLCECVEAALDLLVVRFRKDRICDGCELLYGDWMKARAEYLVAS